MSNVRYRIRFVFLLIFIFSGLISTGFYFWKNNQIKSATHNNRNAFKREANSYNVSIKINNHAAGLKKYAMANGFSANYCMMVDMHIASGKPRFFLYDLQQDTVLLSGLVTHGSGSDRGLDDLFFSNQPNSNCTSLGKYRIGKSYYGKFGLAYKLNGLDNTNSAAFKRFVVLHAHECVPAAAVYPQEICQSWGCPTVAPVFLSTISKYIDQSPKPILLEIYY